MSTAYELTGAAMGTVVSVMIASGDVADRPLRAHRALAWFRHVEQQCSRFEATSELRRLCERVGEAVVVSDLLFEALQFALAVAAASDGAFDPTLGAIAEQRGFNRHWRTGEETGAVSMPVSAAGAIDARPAAGWRQVHLDANRHAVTLGTPMVLDLGALAKGLAIDLAARELADLPDFAIYAGGDLYVSGRNAGGTRWSVGIREPNAPHDVTMPMRVSDMAVCTSGNYERQSSDGPWGHLIDPPAVMMSPDHVRPLSATVLAPSAMVADALATAAFVLGSTRGIVFLEQQQVDGLFINADRSVHATVGMSAYFPDGMRDAG